MALRPMGLANAASNFVNAYTMGKQLQNERVAMAQQQGQIEQQNQIKALMGQALMGQAQPGQMQELAQLDPNSFMKIQQMQAEQQADQAKAQDVLDDERSRSDLMDLASTANPETQSQILSQRIADITAKGGDPSDSQKLLNMPAEQRQNWIGMKAAELGISIPIADKSTFVSDLMQAGIKPGSDEFKAAILDKHGKGKTIGYDVVEAFNPQTKQDEYFQVSRVNPGEKIPLGMVVPKTAAQIKTEAAEAAADSKEKETLTSTLTTVQKILSSPGLSGFSGLDSFRRLIPGSESANVNAWIEQLQSQNFLSAVTQMKGMGALSENEGKKLSAAVAAISSSMSDDAIKKELQGIESNLMTGLERIESGNLLDAESEPESPTVTNWSDL